MELKKKEKIKKEIKKERKKERKIVYFLNSSTIKQEHYLTLTVWQWIDSEFTIREVYRDTLRRGCVEGDRPVSHPGAHTGTQEDFRVSFKENVCKIM